MAETTGIEWCDATFNPWWGCEKVSPGCAHCYAETLSDRFTPGLWGADHGFRFFGDKHWNDPLRWARSMPAKLGRRPRVFCASMADVFEERFELIEPRKRLFRLIHQTPELDWLILTKRPEFMAEELRLWDEEGYHRPDLFMRFPLPNVWLGVSIENARHTWRADVLREIPAAVRFISAEPLLGSLFDVPTPKDPDSPKIEVNGRGECSRCGVFMERNQWQCSNALCPGAKARKPLDLTGIDWVITGGESGPSARPMHPDWAREIRDACLWGDMTPCGDGCCEPPWPRPAFFFKQWGEYRPVIGHLDGRKNLYVLLPTGIEPWNGYQHGASTRWDQQAVDARGNPIFQKLGKKKAGRLLDGREWNEVPDVATVV